MNDALFSFCANIFGFVSGGISLLGIVIAVCRPHLPSRKIRMLETHLHETENIFNEAVEAGLLLPEFVEMTQERLSVLKERTWTYRARTYCAITLSQDCAEFLRGTSTAIGSTCESVKKLRAVIITSSQERRHRLTQTSTEHTPPPSTPPSNPTIQLPPPSLTSNIQDHPIPPPPAFIRSCPSTLPALQSDNVQDVPIDIDGSLERTKSKLSVLDRLFTGMK